MALRRLFSLFYVVIASILFSCESSDDQDDSPAELVANAGEDQQIDSLQEVILDGSKSSDSENRPFDYKWKFLSKPTNSQVVLEESTTVSPSFVPDVAGEYSVELKVENDSQSDTDIVMIIVNETSGVVELEGTIKEDLVLVDRISTPGIADYCVTKDVTIEGELKIEPGVEIHVDENLQFTISGDGYIIAKGTAENPIVFTSKNAGEYWKGLGFILADDVRNELDYVNISYGGSDIISIANRKGTLVMDSFSDVKVTNCTISNSQSAGMYVGRNCQLLDFSNNVFENNEEMPLSIPADQWAKLDQESKYSATNGEQFIEIHEGDVPDDLGTIVWKNPIDQTPFVIREGLSVEAELIMEEGMQLLFEANTVFTVGNPGYLSIKGTEEAPIKMRALDANFSWKGLGFISADNPFNSIDYLEISDAGLDFISIAKRKASITISDFSTISITNTIVKNSISNGMYIAGNVDVKKFENNTFSDNENIPLIVSSESLSQLAMNNSFGSSNGEQYIEVLGEPNIKFQPDSFWNGFDDQTPYYLSGNIGISGSGVTITKNADFLIAPNRDIIVSDDDTYLSIQGTADNTIDFTALDSSLPWKGLGFFSDNPRNELIYSKVSYAGSDVVLIAKEKANVAVGSFSYVNMTNTTLSNSAGYGLYIGRNTDLDAAVIQSNNTFENNVLGSIFE